MESPKTYFEWTKCLDEFREACLDSDIIEIMERGEISLQGEAAIRFYKYFTEVIEDRLKKANERFSKSIKRESADINSFISSTLLFRKEFIFLKRAVEIKSLPEDKTDSMLKLIYEYANRIQADIENTLSKTDRTGSLLSAIKNNKLNKLD